MPSRLLVIDLKENSYYHIYNQGREGRKLFIDSDDYLKFLDYLFIYTAAIDKVRLKYPKLPKRLADKNLSGQVYLIAYGLFEDHFHILLKQKSSTAMPALLKQVTNAYVTYYNKKYSKKGSPFAGRYKSVRIESEYILTQMVRFVHLNPSFLEVPRDFKNYQWSSYKNNNLTVGILNRFSSFEEYEKFHLDEKSYKDNFEKIKKLTIDS